MRQPFLTKIDEPDEKSGMPTSYTSTQNIRFLHDDPVLGFGRMQPVYDQIIKSGMGVSWRDLGTIGVCTELVPFGDSHFASWDFIHSERDNKSYITLLESGKREVEPVVEHMKMSVRPLIDNGAFYGAGLYALKPRVRGYFLELYMPLGA